MSKSEQKRPVLNIIYPDVDYPRTMLFNRLRVEREDTFRVAFFGLFTSSGLLLDSYACCFQLDALKHNKDSLLQYLQKIQNGKLELKPFSMPFQGKCDVADVISMTHSGGHAETSFALYSRMAAYRLSLDKPNDKEKDKEKVIPGQPVALLRSTKEMQQALIEALYD